MPRRIRVKKDRKKTASRSKACRFCTDKDLFLDYKNPRLLSEFITERGKIITRRVTGNCRLHQNRVVQAVKRSRQVALLPYTVTHAVRD